MQLTDVEDLVDMIAYAINNHIPIVGFFTCNYGHDCSNCVSFAKNFIQNSEFGDRIKSNNKYLFIYGYKIFRTETTKYVGTKTTYYNLCAAGHDTSGWKWVVGCLFLMESNGTRHNAF